MPLDFPNTPAPSDTWTAPNGVTYTYDGTKWSAQSGSGGTTPPAFAEPVGAGTWGRLETAAWERSVAVGGDTMTGGLAINTPAGDAWMGLYRAVGSRANISALTGATGFRWTITLADETPETGSNAGSDFRIMRFDDAGAGIDTPLTISRATGNVTAAKILTAEHLKAGGNVVATFDDLYIGGNTTTGDRSINFVAPTAYITYSATSRDIVCATPGGERWRARDSDGMLLTPTHCYIGDKSAGNNCYRPGVTTWDVASDARGKTAVVPYTRGLADVIKLSPVSYQYSGDGAVPAGDVTHVGLTAQDVEPIFPEAVGTMPQMERSTLTDEKSLSMSPILFAFINALKEIDARLTAAGI